MVLRCDSSESFVSRHPVVMNEAKVIVGATVMVEDDVNQVLETSGAMR